MRESAGKAEEGVVGNRIRERCFPNGSRLTLVCGRVEGTSESLFFLFHLGFFNSPLRCEGGYDGPVRVSSSASCPLNDGSVLTAFRFFLSPASSQPSFNCGPCNLRAASAFRKRGSFPRTRSFSQSSSVTKEPLLLDKEIRYRNIFMYTSQLSTF